MKRGAAGEPTHEASAKPYLFELCLARRRKAEGLQWRFGKAQSAQGSPLVFSEILYVGDEHQKVYIGLLEKTVHGDYI